MVTIYTKQFAEEQLNTGSKPDYIIDPKDIDLSIRILKDLRNRSDEIEIYDISPVKNENRVLWPVNDHINRTGTSPLIGRQKSLGVEFIDISDLYVQKSNGVVTVCCGKSDPLEEFEYPSMYLSHLSVLARVMDYKKIHAYVMV